jgi:hypothetical protein
MEQLQEMLEDFQKDCKVDPKLYEEILNWKLGAKERTLSFICKAFKIANDNPHFLPQFVDESLLKGKLRDLENLIKLKQLSEQFAKTAEKAYRFRSIDCYRDALGLYGSLQAAAQRNAPGARKLFDKLRPFFKKTKRKPAAIDPSKPIEENQFPPGGDINPPL